MSRKPIEENVKRRLFAESMGRCMNPNCRKELFMLFDNIKYVSSWNEAYAEIHKELYKAAPQVYEAFLKTEDNAKEQIISKEEASYTKAIELGENLFLNISFRNVKRMIRKLQIFVGFYSENTDVFGGDISEELIFEIA